MPGSGVVPGTHDMLPLEQLAIDEDRNAHSNPQGWTRSFHSIGDSRSNGCGD